MNNIIEK